MGWGGDGRVGAHISDVPGLVKQISTPADENASIMSVAAMLSTVGFRPGLAVALALTCLH